MKKMPVILLFGMLLPILASASPQESSGPQGLAPPYQEWLKLTTYIIRDSEREVFRQLQSDRERDIFIDMFWKQRDPTPATPQNEYRESIVKRFQEANKKFRAGREGWMTDRGRILIILGEPISTIRISGSNDLYPAEIWSYYGDPSKRMPSHYSLVFYQWKNVGEYKLYSPLADGPNRLMVEGHKYDPNDYETLFETIFEVEPDLAKVILSIIPGEIPFGYRPSPETMILMADILESPKRMVNDSYATHFLKYRGIVSTEYLTNMVESKSYAAVFRDPITGLTFCHFGMSPESLSLDYYDPKDEYSANFQVDVSLRLGDKVILQYAKEFPFTVAGDRIDATELMGITIEDVFPVIEGTYRLNVLLRNAIGKEFSVFERDIVVPPTAAGPALAAPVIGYNLSSAAIDVHSPFLVGDRKIAVEPKSTFSAGDRVAALFQATGLTEELWRTGSVRMEVRGMKPPAGAPPAKFFTFPLADLPFRSVQTFGQTFPASELTPDYYDIDCFLLDGGGKVLDSKSAGFVLTTQAGMNHPVSLSKTIPPQGRFLFQYMLAYQYDQTGQPDLAETAYRTAFGQNPGYLAKIPEFAGFLLRTGKPKDALELVEAIREEDKLRFAYFANKGLALLALERYAEAADTLAAANRIYNSDLTVLNGLGKSYYRVGRRAEALEVLNASLKLKPDQDDIRRLVQEIEGR